MTTLRHHVVTLLAIGFVLVGTFLAVILVAAPSSEAICSEVTFGAVVQSCQVQR